MKEVIHDLNFLRYAELKDMEAPEFCSCLYYKEITLVKYDYSLLFIYSEEGAVVKEIDIGLGELKGFAISNSWILVSIGPPDKYMCAISKNDLELKYTLEMNLPSISMILL